MRRYWVEKKFVGESEIILSGDSYHHICDVCRQEEGSKFEVLCEGIAYFIQITSINKKSSQAIAKITENRKIPELSKPLIHLCVSLSKFQTMDTIVEKSVELGVYKMHPFVSDYSFIREKHSPKIQDKHERWNRIVKAATQQCGRGELMEIEPMAGLQETLKKMNQTEHSVGLFPYEGSSQQTIKQSISTLKSQNPEHLWLFVGSEGGFSAKEVELFATNGLKSSTLGDQVLRVETACLSLVAILKYEWSS